MQRNPTGIDVELLQQLYGPVLAPSTARKLQAVADKYRAAIAESFARRPSHRPTDRDPLLTERDIIMIAYGDHLLSASSTPLRSLASWCKDHVSGLISSVHVLPFHPSTSYYGYAITDYNAVDPNLGSWADVSQFEQSGFSLMSDLVLNHCSQSHPWFKQLLRNERPGADYFITRHRPDEAWLNHVKRARNLPLISEFIGADGVTKHYVWTTYHRDLVDLNWANPDVCIEFVDILLDSVARGFRFIRLDAFAYVWKRINTNCVNLPETKLLLRLFIQCLNAAGAGDVSILPSITNVSQQENFEYLLAGAALVYHLPLSALLLHTLYTGASAILSRWLSALPNAPTGHHLLNLASSHDGIGLTWCAGILSDEQTRYVCAKARERGGIVQTRRATAVSSEAQPWEINITYFSACAPDAASISAAERISQHVSRFLVTQSVVVALKGVPALYFALFMAGENDVEGMEAIRKANLDPDAHCIERAINRGRYKLEEWQERMSKPTLHPNAAVLSGMQRLLRVRISHAAFHPDAPQQCVYLDSFPSLLILRRTPLSAEPHNAVVCITNFGSTSVSLSAVDALCLLGEVATVGGGICRDILHLHMEKPDAADEGVLIDARRGLTLVPYSAVWIAAVLKEVSPAVTLAFVASCAPNVVVPRVPLLSDTPALELGVLNKPLTHLLAYRTDSAEGQAALKSAPAGTAKVVHFVRHAQSFHKRVADVISYESGGRNKCFCFEHTLGEAKTKALHVMDEEYTERGGRRMCPYLSAAGFDAPLTADGLRASREELARLPHSIQRIYAAASTRTLQTAVSMAALQQHSTPIVATDLLRPMLGFHTHAHRYPRAVLSCMFPSVDFSRVTHSEDIYLEGDRWESRISMDARASAALADVMASTDTEVAIVAHFTTLYAMLMPASDARIFGARPGLDQRPLLDCSQCPSLARIAAEPIMNEAAVLSLVLVQPTSAESVPHRTVSMPLSTVISASPSPSLDAICDAILRGDAGTTTLSSRQAQFNFTDDRTTSMWHMCLLAAASTPSATAVFGPSLSARLSYGDVLQRSLRLVRRMQQQGVQPGAYVGVCLERGVASVIAAMAVILAGCAFYSVHPLDPPARIALQVGLTLPAALLCSAATKSVVVELGVAVVINIEEEEEASVVPITLEWLRSLRAPPLSQIGYCTFTSGSTGPPKGVLLSHRALLQFLLSIRTYELRDGAEGAAFGATTRVLQLSRSTFDISWFEIMGPLCVGGATVILPPHIDSAFSIETVADSIDAHRATWTFVVPAVVRLLLDHISRAESPRLSSLRSIYVGGEYVPLSLAKDLQSAFPTCRIAQAYGPAECSIFTACNRLAPGDVAFPLGLPLPGYRVVLLDEKERGVSQGQIGTMHVIGNAVFSGYLGHTSDALRAITVGTERVVAYNTGDLARLDATGALHFMGRRDRQVKLHGQRLELAGIEAAASTCGIVRAVAVKKWSVPPDRQFLAAYITWQKEALARSNSAALEKQLRGELSRKLPGWMVPAVFVSVAGDLPRNAHKKVDYNALQPPCSSATETKKALRVCIIGGGVAGLLAAIDAIRRGIEVKIIERCYALGGVWINGAASVCAHLQQPGEYYAVDGPLPTRFPSGGVVAGYLADVASRHRLDAVVLSAEVTDVAPLQNSDGLSVTWQQRAAQTTETFDFVICATGRFSPWRLVRPEWVPSGVVLDARYSALPRFVAASRLEPEKCNGKRIVIVGGGPYAVEAVRLCVSGKAVQLTVIMRQAHWVFPRCWFDSRALTRLFWRLCSGVGLTRRMVLLCKVAVARHYLRAGIGHMIPRLAMADPKTSISDEFFMHARLPRVRYIIGSVESASATSTKLQVRSGSQVISLTCDSVVVACGFERPTYPFLHRFSLELYLGSWAISYPRLCFVGVGLGEGVFPNPHTMRPQVDVVLNHVQHAACARTEEDMRAWLVSSIRCEGEVPGCAAHLSEHLAELAFQRRALLSSAGRRISRPTADRVLHINADAHSSVALAVVHAASEAGLRVSLRNLDDALVTLGMDSLCAVRFRGLLARRFPQHSLPNVGALLWDLPTLRHVEQFLQRAPMPLSSTAVVASDSDIPPLLTRNEAEAYVRDELRLPEVLALLHSEPLTFITRVCEQFHRTVPFQSFTLLNVDRSCRRLPSLAQVRNDVYDRIGGCCYVLNVFMRELLRALGFSTYFARCAIHGVEDCHMTILLRGLSVSSPSTSELWMVDVGCGYITARPVCLTWGPEAESPEYQYGFLRLKFVRTKDESTGEQVLLRLHAAASTFDHRELTLAGKRTDEFTHLFWQMSLRPRPMHDRGETQQARAFVGYQKLRASVGVGPQCRMVYFKGDNYRGELVASKQEDVNGNLYGTPLTRETLIAALLAHFPTFSPASIEAAVTHVLTIR